MKDTGRQTVLPKIRNLSSSLIPAYDYDKLMAAKVIYMEHLSYIIIK